LRVIGGAVTDAGVAGGEATNASPREVRAAPAASRASTTTGGGWQLRT
jgi:hypothetical protein